MPFLTVYPYQVGQLSLGPRVDDIGCGNFLFRTEAHIQRGIVLETEAATTAVELQR